MRKYIFIPGLSLLTIVILILVYLSFFGLKTSKFNDFINEKVHQIDPNLNLKISDVFLKLNLKNKSVNINTNNSKVFIKSSFINLSSININLDLFKFIRNDESVKNIQIISDSNSIKNVTNFLNSYKFSLPRFVIYNQITDGIIKAKVNIDFTQNQKKFTYKIDGIISDANINIFNKTQINNINFNFELRDKLYSFHDIKLQYSGINLISKKIRIEDFGNNFYVEGNIDNLKGSISPKDLEKISKLNLNFLHNKAILAESENNFSFKINKKFSVKDLNLKSIIKFDKLHINKKYQDLIFLEKGEINSNYSDKKLKIKIDSKYSFYNEKYNNNQKDKVQINILKNENKDFVVDALIENNKNTINFKDLSDLIKFDDNIIVKEQDLTFSSNHKINFKIDKNQNIKNFEIKSNLDLDKILINYKSNRINKYLPNFNNQITMIKSSVKVNYKKNSRNIDIKGKYSLNKEFDNFKLKINQNKNSYNFETELELKNNIITFHDIHYHKDKGVYSKINFNGEYQLNKEIKFKNINYLEGENIVNIKNLSLSKNDKIKNLDTIKINYLNKNKKMNSFKFFKEKNLYKLEGVSFDGKSTIENLINDNSDQNFLKNFKNLNTKILLNLKKYYLDDKNYLDNLDGLIEIEKNKIKFANISANLNNNDKFSLNIKKNSNNEKVTNLFIEKPKPFIKYYKFIKGFDEGSLSYDSIEKNGKSISKLKIYDFKVKKVPVLAKLLTLASLQGIADLLTGEGIRFEEFEMDYESTKKNIKINEIYAIGPAISILMDGYIVKNKLLSLRGTLVPATTINKTIAKIPLLGNILVGKKVGEGVFGVSFKIKGPPKNPETTVNPIKTLTPRFITRTLDKLKKN